MGISALEKEMAELCLPIYEEDDLQKRRDFSERSKPFSAFGSFRQRHGDIVDPNLGRTIEAPAKLGSSASSHRGGLSEVFATDGIPHPNNLRPALVDCSRSTSKPPNPLRKFLSKGKLFSTDLDREEAWERKKEQYLLEAEEEDCDKDEEYSADEGFYDALSEHSSSSSESEEGNAHHDGDKDIGKHVVGHGDVDDDDASHDDGHVNDGDKGIAKHIVGHGNLDDDVEELHIHNDTKRVSRRTQSFRKKAFPRSLIKPTRTKSLTDEDLEELRGSIDLGFGFSYSERCNLKSTLPALELYYAINKNYVDAQFRSSPISPLEGNALHRTNSAGSTSSPSNESWRISSPGDHPSQVKTRLRHWAQVVACSVKQGY